MKPISSQFEMSFSQSKFITRQAQPVFRLPVLRVVGELLLAADLLEDLLADLVAGDLAALLELGEDLPDAVVGQPVAGQVEGLLDLGLLDRRLAIGTDLQMCVKTFDYSGLISCTSIQIWIGHALFSNLHNSICIQIASLSRHFSPKYRLHSSSTWRC